MLYSDHGLGWNQYRQVSKNEPEKALLRYISGSLCVCSLLEKEETSLHWFLAAIRGSTKVCGYL